MKEATISELSVIIPAYNEEKTIERCINEIVQFCTDQNFDYENNHYAKFLKYYLKKVLKKIMKI